MSFEEPKKYENQAAIPESSERDPIQDPRYLEVLAEEDGPPGFEWVEREKLEKRHRAAVNLKGESMANRADKGLEYEAAVAELIYQQSKKRFGQLRRNSVRDPGPGI